MRDVQTVKNVKMYEDYRLQIGSSGNGVPFAGDHYEEVLYGIAVSATCYTNGTANLSCILPVSIGYLQGCPGRTLAQPWLNPG